LGDELNPNADLHLGPKGAALIHEFESLQLKAYVDTHEKDGSPRWAIGWGHTRSAGPPVPFEGMEITEDEANEIFARDMLAIEDKVRHYVRVPLNQNQFDALCSAAFNMQTSHFVDVIESSKLNDGNYAGVLEALAKWDTSAGRKLRGLTRRRREEGELFNTPVEVT